MATLRRNNRRPPRDPSAALRPKNALEKAAMTQFRQKVQTANQVSICNTTSDQVGRLPMREILSRDVFCVPIFQRRYCWGETQWQTLLDDACTTRTSSSSTSNKSVVAGMMQQHSMGRLTCTNQAVVPAMGNIGAHQLERENLLAGVKGRSCILDGQQRFTSVTILLSAIRDLLQEKIKEMSTQTAENDWGGKIQTAINSIDDLLFSNLIQMRAWMYRPDAKLEEGVELPFARLVPTFCDRWSYYSAILPSSTTVDNVLEASSSSSSSWHRPLAAKRFFLSKLEHDFSSPTQLSNLLTCVLDGLTMLYFPVDVNQGYNDGTEDLMVIYERLALRDATFCKPRREEEYLSMDGVDMIRNLLLGSFHEQRDALDFYKDYWLPIEKLTSEKSYGRSIQQVLEAFLEKQKDDTQVELADSKHNSGTIGGKIYADFQAWLEEATNCSVMKDDNTPEEKVSQVGKELLDFACTLRS